MKLRINNEEIVKWLEEREWLTHYWGNGIGTFAQYSCYSKEQVLKGEIERCRETGFPLRGNKYITVDLDKEYMATYSMPIVHFKMCQSQLDENILDIQIHFAHLRAGEGYEQVFRDYVQSLKQVKQVFILLGVDKKYLE